MEISSLISLATSESAPIYNPFYFYGKNSNTALDGLKTEYSRQGKSVAQLSCRDFLCLTNERISGGDFSPVPCPDADVFLFSHIEELAGFSQAQEFFFFLFNRLFERDTIIAISSTSHYSLLTGFESRIITLLQGCLVCKGDKI